MDNSYIDPYPLVQDLTDAENGCSSSSSKMLGNFSLKDLAVPTFPPRDLYRKTLSKYTENNQSLESEINHYSESLERTSTGSFDDNFVLTRQVSKCRVSTIWECVHRESGDRYCAKIIDRRRFTKPQDEIIAMNELKIMSFLKEYATDAVVQAMHITQDSNNFYLVMDYLEMGSLHDRISTQRLREEQVQSLARSLLQVIVTLHALGIGHFDLQPENILLRTGYKSCLCDFGSASFVTDKRNIRCQRNLAYVAPEDILKRPCLASDMWSVGVILFYCLSGRLPFEASSNHRLQNKILSHEYNFSAKEWTFVSRSAKQLVSALLHPDPEIRMTANEALNHPWFSFSHPARLVVKRRRRGRLLENFWSKIKKQSAKEESSEQTATYVSSSFSSHEEPVKEET